MVLELNDKNFDTQIKKGIVIVDFWAEWCGPCQMFKSIFEKVAEEMKGKAVFGKLNVDKNPDSSQNHNVFSIPTIIVFKDGQEIDRLVGALPENTFKAKLKEYVK